MNLDFSNALFSKSGLEFRFFDETKRQKFSRSPETYFSTIESGDLPPLRIFITSHDQLEAQKLAKHIADELVQDVPTLCVNFTSMLVQSLNIAEDSLLLLPKGIKKILK